MATTTQRRIGLVTDEASNLSPSFIEANEIEVVTFPVWFSDDEEEVTDTQALYQKMRETKKSARTAAPPPFRFKKAYRKALEKCDEILVVLLSSNLSGSLESARNAKEQMPTEDRSRIELFDSRFGSVAEGLVVWKAQELIDRGDQLSDILQYLDSFRSQIKLFGFIEDLNWLVYGGRLREPWATAALALQKTGIRPAVGITDGQVKMSGLKVVGKETIPAILKELKKASAKGKLNIAIAHADASEDDLSRLRQGIEDIDAELLFISQLTPLVGAHTGPGTVLVGYYGS